jgi:hypothetical protein
MNIAIAGAGGRMGRILIEAVQNADDARLSGALDRAGSEQADAAAFLGKPAGVPVESDLARAWPAPVPDRLHPPGSDAGTPEVLRRARHQAGDRHHRFRRRRQGRHR